MDPPFCLLCEDVTWGPADLVVLLPGNHTCGPLAVLLGNHQHNNPEGVHLTWAPGLGCQSAEVP